MQCECDVNEERAVHCDCIVCSVAECCGRVVYECVSLCVCSVCVQCVCEVSEDRAVCGKAVTCSESSECNSSSSSTSTTSSRSSSIHNSICNRGVFIHQ